MAKIVIVIDKRGDPYVLVDHDISTPVYILDLGPDREGPMSPDDIDEALEGSGESAMKVPEITGQVVLKVAGYGKERRNDG